MIARFRSIASSVAVVALTAGFGFAATSWTPSSGSTDNFNFNNGQTENGLFTDSAPDVFEDTLLFFPVNFTADDNNNSVSDQLSFVTSAKPGGKLQKVSATLTGDYSSEELIPSFAKASFIGFGGTSAMAQLMVTNTDTSATLSQAVTFTPSSPFVGSGAFTGTASLNVPSTWVNILVQLDATLQAFGDTTTLRGNTASALNSGNVIQLKGTNIELQAAAVPLPGAVLAAPGAMLVAWVARRKMAKR